MKTIIMPCEPFNSKYPEPMFEAEYNSAKKFGNVFLLDFEEFVEGKLLKKLPHSKNKPEPIFYHGWMLDKVLYQRFYSALDEKGYQLTTNPLDYSSHHYFNGWYPHMEGLTPKSKIVYDENLRPILDEALALQRETNSALIIKDAVKSLKHDWFEACFIPENAHPIEMAKVIGNFLAIKKENNDLKLPVVIRQFEKLVSIGTHPKSGMPISHEYRTYVYKGEVLFQTPYWDTTYKKTQEPPKEYVKSLIDHLMTNCPSPLFTIDTALKQDGNWTCIEVGDGQVSSLPDNADKEEFFSKLLGE